MPTHRGGCHCGRVRFEVEGPEHLELDECNCSICTMSGYLHHVVHKDKFHLIAGAEHLSNYSFGTGIADHPFCAHCGIKSFYIPRAYPEGVSVNARCLDTSTVRSMKVVRRFDGANWEKAHADYTPPDNA